MTGCLVRISPLDPATGNRVDVYLSSFGHRADAAANGLDGRVWEPAITQRPTLAMTAWNGDFTAAIEPGAATLPVNLEIAAQTWPNIGRYGWTGAPIAIFGGKPGDAWPWETLFAGRVRSYSGTYPRLSLQAQVDTEPFDADVLTARYAGTGGAEGGDDIKNRLKPLVVGWAKSVEPVLVDAVNDVWQFSGHGPIEAVTTLYERASAFGASDGDHADYAALVAASIAPGHWATCLAGGMIRLGAPAYGVITGDIRGHKTGASTPRLTGAVIALLADIADIDPALIVDSTLTALNAAVPYPINIVLSDQVSFIDIARRLALACNWQAGVSLTGKFFGAGVSLAGPPALTLDAQGKASPQVLQSEELHVSPPYSSTILGADRCWRTHTASEIAYVEGLTGYLTHPSHSVAADPDGNVSDFTGVGGSFIVERDGSPLTTGVVFSVASEAGVDVDIDADTGEYSVLGMAPGGQGIAVFKAVLGAETLFAGYSISKSVAGATAKAFAIKGGGNFRYNSAGAIYAGQSVALTLDRQNMTDDFVVRLRRINANGTTTQIDAGTYLAGSGSVTDNVPDALSFTQTGTTVTLTGTNFNTLISTGLGCIVEVTCGAITDSTRMLKVQDGAVGDAGDPGLSVAELTIYRRSASTPATPIGGLFDFDTQTLTPPALWSVAIPAINGDPLYTSKGGVAISGASGSATPGWGAPVLSLKDAEAVNVVFRRLATQPSTPSPSSGIPASWSATPPGGADPLWATYGSRPSPAVNWTWGTPARVEGPEGDPGLSVAELTIYRRASSTPATPSGGTYNFSTKVLSGVMGWTTAIPAPNGDPLYAARGTAALPGTTGTTTPTWAAPTKVLEDAASSMVIFMRFATQPSAPGPSPGVPTLWSATPPAPNGHPLWVSYGGRPSPAVNWTWGTPARVEGPEGAPAVSITVTRKSVTLLGYANGNVISFAEANGHLTVHAGGADVTASATLSATANGCTGTINTSTNNPVGSQPKGYYRITAMSQSVATLTLQAVYNGTTYTEIVTFTRSDVGYEIVGSLPGTNLFEGRVVFLTTDDKLYRYTGSAWVASVAAGDVTGQLTNAQIADIAAAKLTGQIATTQIADNAISTPKLAAGSVSTNKLAANAVTANELAANAVTTPKLAAGAVTANEIAANAVTANKIDAGAVTASKLAATNVITASAQIGDGIITNAKIGNLEVDSAKIANLTVGTEKIANSAVSNTVVTQLTGTANYNEGTVYDVVDRTITTTGGKVLLNAMLSLMFKAGVHTGYGGAPAGFATLVMNFNFYRGASLMATLGAHYVMVPQNCLYSIPLSFSWVDDPSAGTYNYRLTAEAVAAADWNGANTWSRTLAHMSATELKK